jgi:hypothetical protein
VRLSPHTAQALKRLLLRRVTRLFLLSLFDINVVICLHSIAKTKREAIEKVYPDIIAGQLPAWNKDKELLIWLSELK